MYHTVDNSTNKDDLSAKFQHNEAKRRHDNFTLTDIVAGFHAVTRHFTGH